MTPALYLTCFALVATLLVALFAKSPKWFWRVAWLVLAVIGFAIASMSMKANDAAHEAEKADVDAGRWP